MKNATQHINVFLADKINAIKFWTTKPSCASVEQNGKGPIAKI